jgi:hypothetical protein
MELLKTQSLGSIERLYLREQQRCRAVVARINRPAPCRPIAADNGEARRCIWISTVGQ